MNDFKLSTRQDWADHWEKHELVRTIPEDYCFPDLLKWAASLAGNSGTSIELGGFPGSFSVYLTKYCRMKATLLDYFIHRQTIASLLEKNGLKPDDIEIVEEDVFSYMPKNDYDLVCSFGFIEHFTDLEKVLQSHLKFMKAGGTLLVTLPNFCGINGLLQKVFDPANLAIHNLAVMDLTLLRGQLYNLGMEDIRVEYYPSTQVWLEGLRKRNLIVRAIVRIVNESVKLLSKAFGKQCKWFSNSIVILAKRPL